MNAGIDNDDLEHLLRRYEPSAPSSSLRARVLHGSPDAGRAWPWAVAAAALLATTIWLHGSRNRVLQEPLIDDVSSSHTEEALLTDMLGGGDEARRIAERIVALEEAARETGAVATSGSNGGRQ
jgi:hypothetical protein